MALSPDETRLMVIGNFRKIAGVDRPLIARSTCPARPPRSPTGAPTSTTSPARAAARSGSCATSTSTPTASRAYVVSAGHFYYPACDTLNAFPMDPGGSNLQPVWSDKIGDTMEAVAADRDAVYMSGHFRYLETETHTGPRFQIAAVDPDTGEGINWIPNAGGSAAC